ncbi:hypothetical protein APR41_16610 [Salegentibacter salinarum]|uniref:DUF4870 domain-containing protein n=1 Tax=Salegentibacter salinarum TaxID=447422 RepID=A0A2N0TWW5_9FLAO|nr:DUF4870 domain-containing protein [Salegentibacter salinarum]PKD19211.1 hypothetical protein APR41_16610 [Salegentibacter salinarum]SKB94418.1 hypothetical protein SAMN05660903_03399 [Salegentibacter salinarum]
MNSKIAKEEKTLATILHLSVFSKFIIPFGNFIFPLILWLTKKEKPFIDDHGRKAINFQISLFLYTILILAVGISIILFQAIRLGGDVPFAIGPDHFYIDEMGQAISIVITISVFAILLSLLFFIEIFAVISASIKASNGENYSFPLSINFIGKSSDNHHNNNHQQSKKEQFNNPQNETL